MANVLENEEKLTEVFKSAIVEVLQERSESVRDLLGGRFHFEVQERF